jgi:hypothetical protein
MTATDGNQGGELITDALAPGTYTILVSERDPGNSVFYDLQLLTPIEIIFSDRFEQSL